MPAAPQSDVGDRCLTSNRKRLDVMELQRCRFAATSLGTAKGASAFITLPHGALHCRRNAPRFRIACSRFAWCVGLCQLRPFEVRDEQ
jgi:hypothetical protein